MSDSGTTYRSRDEIQVIRTKHDPIKILSSKILSLGLSTEKELNDIEQESKRIVENATEKALSDQAPTIQDMFTDICAKSVKTKGVFPSMIRWNAGEPN